MRGRVYLPLCFLLIAGVFAVGALAAEDVGSPPPPPPPTVGVSGSPNPVSINTFYTVSWSSTDATSCSTDFGGGTGTSGSVQLRQSVAGDYTYTVTCTG